MADEQKPAVVPTGNAQFQAILANQLNAMEMRLVKRIEAAIAKGFEEQEKASKPKKKSE